MGWGKKILQALGTAVGTVGGAFVGGPAGAAAGGTAGYAIGDLAGNAIDSEGDTPAVAAAKKEFIRQQYQPTAAPKLPERAPTMPAQASAPPSGMAVGGPSAEEKAKALYLQKLRGLGGMGGVKGGSMGGMA